MKLIIYLFIFLITVTSHAFALNIVTSINPLYQITKFISADKNKILLLVNPNISEHDYMPKPSDIRNINNSDLIFYISNDLEYYLPKILKSTNNKARIIELINSPNLKLLKIKNNKVDKNYKIDPHIWLNPDNAIIIAQIITENLSELDPKYKDYYHNNLKKFISEIKTNTIFHHAALPRAVKNQGFSTYQYPSKDRYWYNNKKIKQNNYLIYHNCYQYFEDYYQLNSSKIIPYFQNIGPGISDIKKAEEIIKKDNIKCIIAQPQEESRVALEIANANKIKFIIADIIGSKNYDEKNGYIKLINDLVVKFSDCE